MRNILDPSKVAVLNNLSKMVDKAFKMEGYLISEQDIADKYKVSVDEVILLEKEGVLFELDIKNPKVRRATILNNIYKQGMGYYREINSGLNSNFTDALVVNSQGKLLLLKRTSSNSNFPNLYCLPGGHLETAYLNSPERNVKKEIKEETGLDVLNCNLVDTKTIKNNKKIYYFYCSIITEDSEVILNEREHSQYKWVSLTELKEIPKEEFIFDLKNTLLDMIEAK